MHARACDLCFVACLQICSHSSEQLSILEFFPLVSAVCLTHGKAQKQEMQFSFHLRTTLLAEEARAVGVAAANQSCQHQGCS
jgi:hypothetical protein